MEENISSKLEHSILSLPDENMRAVVREDRENNRAKRTGVQEVYAHQLEEMESRVVLYAKLEDLATQMVDARKEDTAKKARAVAPNAEGALDTLRSLAKNYRLLEDAADRLVDTVLGEARGGRKP